MERLRQQSQAPQPNPTRPQPGQGYPVVDMKQPNPRSPSKRGFGGGISTLEPNDGQRHRERGKAEEYKRALQSQMQERKKREQDDRYNELAQVCVSSNALHEQKQPVGCSRAVMLSFSSSFLCTRSGKLYKEDLLRSHVFPAGERKVRLYRAARTHI